MTEIDDLEDIGAAVYADASGPRPDNVRRGRLMLQNSGNRPGPRGGAWGGGRRDKRLPDAKLRKF